MKHTALSYHVGCLLAGVGLALNSQAATIRVPQDKNTIQMAVTGAANGDTILVSDGVYSEYGIIITQALTIKSVNGNAVTTVNGKNLGGVFQVNTASTNKVVLQGLSIIGGSVSGGWAPVRRVAGQLEVRECAFSQNYANGGVIDARGGTDYSLIEPDKTLVIDCIFSDNSAENFPGIVAATAIRCLLYRNNGWNNAIVLTRCKAVNCTVYGNTGGFFGGGVDNVSAVNCIVWGNSAPQVTAGVLTFSLIEGGYAGTGNLSSDPMFVNATNGNFHLLPGSPAINAGDPSILDADGSRSDMGAYGGTGTYLPCIARRATATADLYHGFVVGATVTDPGCGYTTAPSVRIIGPGTGASGFATVSNGVVSQITITDAGGGYSTNTTILIDAPYLPWLEMVKSKMKVTEHVVLGKNYVLESSFDRVNWNQVGSQFTATAEVIVQEFDVAVTGPYFRIRQVP